MHAPETLTLTLTLTLSVSLCLSLCLSVQVSSPWLALRFGGCAVVAAAVISPALNRLGSSPAPVWLGIVCLKGLEGFAALASAVAGASLHLAESSASLSAANTAQVASRAWLMLLRPFLQLGIGGIWSLSVWFASAGQGAEDRSALLHPLLVYLIPACLGSISVWCALD